MTERIQKLKGTVVSTKMQKTAVVEVTRLKKHPKYKKYFRVTKRYKAHNEDESLKAGDKVTIESARPISKEKRWVIIGPTQKSA